MTAGASAAAVAGSRSAMHLLDALPRLAELSAGAARNAGSIALSVVRALAAPLLGRRSDDDASGWTRRWEPPSSRPVGEPPPPPGAPRRPAATTPASPPPPAPPEPRHVDRGATVVAESADAGAADGAGAEVRVDEPWKGYSRLTVRDITAQLATASPATLAVVRLYESSHRKRRTVLADVDRRLAAAGG